MFRKKSSAAEKKAALSVAYDTANQKINVTVQNGFCAALNGADFPQIVGKDGKVHPPLTAQTVLLSFRLTGPGGAECVTGDYPVRIPGLHSGKPAHSKPSVIPEIAQWHSASSGWFTPSAQSAIVLPPDAGEALRAVAAEFQQDYRAITGTELSLRYDDAPKAGDFCFALSEEEAYLGREGYHMETGAWVQASSSHPDGLYWATRTLLQILRQSGTSLRIPHGEMRDYPKYSVRGFMLDIGRRPFSLETLRNVAKNMAWYKLNDLQLHLNDNYIWLEEYNSRGEETDSFEAYEAMRLESSLQNGQGETATAKDYAYTKAEFKAFLEEAAQRYHVQIVPEIDVPAHALSFANVFPEHMVVGKTSPLQKGRPLTDHLDVSRPETIEFVKRIFDDYTGGEHPVFGPGTTVHIGADEFLSDYSAYRRFVNELVPHLKQTNPVRLWGGLTWIKDDPETQILPEAIENVQMNLWACNWADGMEMYRLGYQLINTIDHLLYMVPNGKGNKGSYADFLNKKMVYQKFDPRKVRLKKGKYQALPAGDPQMLGAAYALWNDNIDKKASGLTETDLFLRFFDALPLFAEKAWANGCEKGSAAAIDRLTNKTAFAPGTNPLRCVSTASSLIADYRFDAARPLEDASGNGRSLSAPVHAECECGLVLHGGESFVETPLQSLEMGAFLECRVTFAEKKPGQILLECDPPYGTHDIRFTASGKLGFTREGYEYEFPCEVPVGQPLTLRIETGIQETALSVNGQSARPATGKFIHNGTVRCEGIKNASFHLPAARIGSRSNSVRAKMEWLRIGKAPGSRGKKRLG